MPVTAEVRAENRRFTRTIENSKRQLRDLQNTARRGVSIGGLAVSAGLLVGLRNVAVEMDRIEKLSRQINSTVEETQQLEFISSQNGANLENTVKGLSQLDRRLGDVGRNPRAQQALERLGIELVNIREASPIQRMFMLADAFTAAGDRGRALADVYELTGRQAVEFQQLLELGGDTLRDLADAAPVVDEEDIRNITRLNDELDKLSKRGRKAGAQLLGGINEGVDLAGLGLAGLLGEFEALRIRISEGAEAAAEYRQAMGEVFAEEAEGRAADDRRAALAPLQTAVADLGAEYDRLRQAWIEAETPGEELWDAEIARQAVLEAEITALERQRSEMEATSDNARERLQLQEELLRRQVELEHSLVREKQFRDRANREQAEIDKAAEAREREARRAEEERDRLEERATERTSFEKIGGRFDPRKLPDAGASALDYLRGGKGFRLDPAGLRQLPAKREPGDGMARTVELAERAVKAVERVEELVGGLELNFKESTHG